MVITDDQLKTLQKNLNTENKIDLVEVLNSNQYQDKCFSHIVWLVTIF